MRTICQLLGLVAYPMLGGLLVSAGAWIVTALWDWWDGGEQLPEVGHVDRAGNYVHPSGRSYPNPEARARDIQPTKTLVSQ